MTGVDTSWSPTIAASNVERVVRFGVTRGVELCAGEFCSTRVPARKMFEVWAQLVAALDSKLPIQIAQHSSLDDLQLLGFLVTTAPSVRAGLETFVKYSALLSDAFAWSLRHTPRALEVRWHSRVPVDLGVRVSLETSLAQFAQGVRQVAGADVDPLLVEFAHQAPPGAAAHRAFFRGPIRWDGAGYRLVFARHVLDAVPRQANAALWSYLCAQAERARRELSPQPLAARVHSEIARALAEGRTPRLGDLAERLGLSERSLRRQLSRTGAFRELVDNARRERARELLAKPGASVTHVALELGFADSSALAHACRRWFAQVPSALKRSP